jgi:hypothetical protein
MDGPDRAEHAVGGAAFHPAAGVVAWVERRPADIDRRERRDVEGGDDGLEPPRRGSDRLLPDDRLFGRWGGRAWARSHERHRGQGDQGGIYRSNHPVVAPNACRSDEEADADRVRQQRTDGARRPDHARCSGGEQDFEHWFLTAGAAASRRWPAKMRAAARVHQRCGASSDLLSLTSIMGTVSHSGSGTGPSCGHRPPPTRRGGLTTGPALRAVSTPLRPGARRRGSRLRGPARAAAP